MEMKALVRLNGILLMSSLVRRHNFCKISPDPSFPKRGITQVPLWKRGIEGDFKNIKYNVSILMNFLVIALSVFVGIDYAHAANVRDTKSLCLECHSKAASLREKPVVHSPVKEGKCTACHNPHASKYSGLLADSDSTLCFNCHERKKGFDGRVVHKPAAHRK